MLKSNDGDNPTNLDDLDAELDEISADGADDTESQVSQSCLGAFSVADVAPALHTAFFQHALRNQQTSQFSRRSSSGFDNLNLGAVEQCSPSFNGFLRQPSYQTTAHGFNASAINQSHREQRPDDVRRFQSMFLLKPAELLGQGRHLPVFSSSDLHCQDEVVDLDKLVHLLDLAATTAGFLKVGEQTYKLAPSLIAAVRDRLQDKVGAGSVESKVDARFDTPDKNHCSSDDSKSKEPGQSIVTEANEPESPASERLASQFDTPETATIGLQAPPERDASEFDDYDLLLKQMQQELLHEEIKMPPPPPKAADSVATMLVAPTTKARPLSSFVSIRDIPLLEQTSTTSVVKESATESLVEERPYLAHCDAPQHQKIDQWLCLEEQPKNGKREMRQSFTFQRSCSMPDQPKTNDFETGQAPDICIEVHGNAQISSDSSSSGSDQSPFEAFQRNKTNQILHQIEEEKSTNGISSFLEDQSDFQGYINQFTPANRDLRKRRVTFQSSVAGSREYPFIERPRDSGDPIKDHISNFAYLLGVDPQILTERDALVYHQALNRLALSMPPLSTAPKSKTANARRGGISINVQSTDPAIRSQIEELRNLLFVEKIQSDELQDRSRIRRSSKISDISALSRTKQTVPVTLHVEEEVLKTKAQTLVLTLALKRLMHTLKLQRKSDQQKHISLLLRQERKAQEIMEMFPVLKTALHFAFLFASPLVLQKSDKAFKYFPQLDFAKEFAKIRESIEAAQVKINIAKRQCTTESLQEVLAQKPLGLHFSGHGLLNNQELGLDFYERHKGEGDFLVLENNKGSSELVSRQQLKKMIRQNKCVLEFVFVATCHSEFVGRIFLEAGARHVICIQHSEMVLDKAVIAFTDTFYTMLFEQNKKICTAFEQAQLTVEISFSKKEAEIFKLLLIEDLHDLRLKTREDGRPSCPSDIDQTILSGRQRDLHTKCAPFGPFQKGHYTLVAHSAVHLQNKAPKVPNLRGRQTDMFRVMDKLLASKNSRLFTLIGWPGVGKSALVASMLEYISERALLKGGSIYFNARNIAMCELFIRNFNQVLIAENPTLFGIARQQDYSKQEPIKTLVSILSKIATIEGEILLVIDNAETLISNQRNDFQMLLSMMLTRVSQLSILLTSQRPLQQSRDFKEEIIQLKSLSEVQSANLFKEVMGRELGQAEINGLLWTKPNFEKYPLEQSKWPYKTLHEHHLFTVLHGNPQSIILVASLLADPQKKLTLKQVYCKLTCENLIELLHEEGIQEQMQVSLKLSAQLSFQTVFDNDPESTQLLFLLGLLPGGICPQDLDLVWAKVTQRHIKCLPMIPEASAGNSGPLDLSVSGSEASKIGSWRRAFQVLEQCKLAEEKIARRRAFNSRQIEHPDGGDAHAVKADTVTTVIISPAIVREFSQGNILQEMSDFFFSIFGLWYYEQLHSIYTRNENVVCQSHRKGSEPSQVLRDFERLEENLQVFVSHAFEKYAKVNSPDKVLAQQEKGACQSDDDDFAGDSLVSDCDSEGEVCQAERLFGNAEKDTGQFGPLNQRLTATFFNEKQDSKLNMKRRQTHQPRMQMKKGSSLEDIYWLDLKEAYQETNRRKQAFAKLRDVSEPQGLQHPRKALDRMEKATQYWRWAYKKVMALKKNQQLDNLIQNANLSYNFGHLQEELFSGDEAEGETFAHDKSKPEPKSGDRDVTIKKHQSSNHLLAGMVNLDTFKLPGKQRKVKTDLLRRQQSRLSMFERKRLNSLVVSDGDGNFGFEEKTLVYYLVNLVLFKQFNVADSVITKYFLPMTKCSDLFKANVRRMHALSEFLQHKRGSESSVEAVAARSDKIQNSLRQAQTYYRRANCAWGLALTYFQHAVMLELKIEQNQTSFSSSHNQLVHQVQELLSKAAAKFKVINHVRGLCCTYRHLQDLAQHVLDLQQLDQSNDEVSSHAKLYRRYLHLYDLSRLSEGASDLIIQRSGGDDFTLLTEIVVTNKNTKLFREHVEANSDDSLAEDDDAEPSQTKATGL